MKVKDMPYEHLTIEEIREELQAVLAEIQNAKCHNCVLRARERMLKLLLRYSSNASLCYIRYSCNTADEYYVKEHEYFDEILQVAGPIHFGRQVQAVRHHLKVLLEKVHIKHGHDRRQDQTGK